MNKLLFTAALAPVGLLLSACGDNAAETEDADTAVVETDTADNTTAAADPNWPDWDAAYMVAEQSGKDLPQ